MPTVRTARVALLLYPGCMPAGLFAAADLLHAANVRVGRAAFEPVWCAARRGAVACAHGVRMTATHALADADPAGVLIPGQWTADARAWHAGLAEQFDTVQGLARLPRRTSLWAYCTGVALLAEAGRLRAEPATAAWWMAPWLSARHGNVDWQWQRTLAQGRGVATASGVHGHLALMAAQVQRVVGDVAWADIARLMLWPRPRQQAPAFAALALSPLSEPFVARLHAVVERTPATQCTTDTLAAALAVSPRTLARRVQALVGESVGAHVRRLKLHQAAERLVHAKAPVAKVCADLGYPDEASFRRSFKQVTGMTPTAFVAAECA